MLSTLLRPVADAALVLWLLLGPLCWILRDGLGPGAVESQGLPAAGRFLMTFWWGPVLVGLAAVQVALRRRPARAGTVTPPAPPAA